jgi:hypothetical protein
VFVTIHPDGLRVDFQASGSLEIAFGDIHSIVYLSQDGDYGIFDSVDVLATVLEIAAVGSTHVLDVPNGVDRVVLQLDAHTLADFTWFIAENILVRCIVDGNVQGRHGSLLYAMSVSSVLPPT